VNDSTQLLGRSAAHLRAAGAQWTAREIAQQPQLWPEIARQISADEGLEKFLAPLLADPSLRIMLTGAGSSSYIGRCLAPALSKAGRPTAAIPTTDMVTNPSGTLAPKTPTLMVHFARSGNSPESLAALELAEQQTGACHHLIVTCNGQGALSRRAASVRHAYSVILPEACNDQSFAMTSSFTGMLLAAALALDVMSADRLRIAGLSQLGAHVLVTQLPLISDLVREQSKRVVYLGSNELMGLAFEAALKMLELTDGKVVSLGESSLGFRHGPKTIIDDSALVIAFLSNDAYTRRYDLDLLNELRNDDAAGRVVALSGGPDDPEHRDTVALSAGTGQGPGEKVLFTDLELCLPYACFAQTLALLRSLSLGLTPDSPNAAGTVSRVVRGVTIYPPPEVS
jgi:tagatose-6-phosphate ketose/aldose isomerase